MSYAIRKEVTGLSYGGSPMARELISVSESSLDLWRDGATGMRPKWGIYRSIGSNGSLKS